MLNIEHSKFIDWESVFKNPAPVEIKTLRTGTIISKVSGILNLKNKNAVNLKDSIVKMPVLAHILHHKKCGNYLIDTGFDSSFSKEIGGNFKGILKRFYFKNCYIQEKSSEGIEKQLKEEQINLNGVFLTHFHEHSSASPSLPDEIPFIYGEGEAEINFFPLIYSRFLKNKINLKRIDFSKGQKMPILGNCIDIFKDGSFWAVPTPGHTKGHTSYLVNGQKSQILITGDACISKKGFDLEIEPGKFSSDIKQGKESFLKLVKFANQYPNLEILFGHETNEFKIELFDGK